MFKRIVVPLDGCGFGDHAIRYATAIAQSAGAAIELVHVHVPAHLDGDPFTLTPYRFQGVVRYEADLEHGALDRDAERLDERARRLAKATGLPVSSRLLAGRVDAAVEQEAAQFHADLIVMATHARTGYARARLGSVGDAVVRLATMPVLLVRPLENGSEPELPPHFASIVVALDGSAFSEQILEPAVGFAGLFDARLTLFHTPPDRPGRRHYNDRLRFAEEASRAGAGAQYLRRIAARVEARVPRVDIDVVTHEEPSTAILYTANDRDADLIAMATHGRGGMSRLLFGSTTDLVLRQTHRPLLVARPVSTAAFATSVPVYTDWVYS